MRPKRSSILALLLAGLALSARADIVSSLGPLTLSSVRTQGMLKRSATDSEDLLFLPRVEARPGVRAAVDSVDPNVVVELLAWARVPGAKLETPQGRLLVYNALRSVSRLEGLQYYSASHRQDRLLYKLSYRISEPASRQRLPDLFVTDPPARDALWVYQEDTTFGGNVYAVTYENGADSVVMRVENTTVMRTLFLPVVRPNGMVTQFVIVPWGDEVLFYAVAAAHMAGPFARPGAGVESFSNRVVAMYRWFQARVGAVP